MTRQISPYRLPSAEELYAAEQQARRLRAQALATLIGDAGRGIRALYSRAVNALSTKVVRHA